GFQSSKVKILVGIVQPHFASGFIGGPDLLLPGASSLKTIEANRSLTMNGTIDPLRYKENPIHKDSLEAAKMIGETLLITVVLDKWGRIAGFYCGELEPTFTEAVSQYVQQHSWTLDTKPDIIVASSDGSYYSNDLYHAVRILPFLWNIQKRDGSTIVLAGECRNGIGDADFLTYSKNNEGRKSLQTSMKKQGFTLGGHVALLLKEALEKSRVQLVSVLPDVYTRSFGLKPSRTVSAGVQSAVRAEGKDAKILIIPRGSIALPTIQPSPQD
ncbi:MAG TPA: lactate racemase domain-containing protein, partial [Candidatus Binatus sp.]|nr:lactate racemase domain-containing protein [Candidatus Binatus sp.]